MAIIFCELYLAIGKTDTLQDNKSNARAPKPPPEQLQKNDDKTHPGRGCGLTVKQDCLS